MSDLERRLEELFMSDARARRVDQVNVSGRGRNRFAPAGFLAAVALAAVAAIVLFNTLRPSDNTAAVPSVAPSASASASASASSPSSPTASTTPSGSNAPSATTAAGVRPDTQHGIIVPTGGLRTEADPQPVQDPAVLRDSPSTASVSPDGKRVAFIRISGSTYQIRTFTTARPNDVATILDLTGTGEITGHLVWAGDGSNTLLFEATKETRGQGGDDQIWEYSALRTIDVGTREVREIARVSGQNRKLWPLAWLPAQQLAGALEMEPLGPIGNYVVVRSGTIERTAFNPKSDIGKFDASRDGQRILMNRQTGLRWWPVGSPSAAKDLPGRGDQIAYAEFRPGADEIGVDVPAGGRFEIWTLDGAVRVVAMRVTGFSHWRADGTAAIVSPDPNTVLLLDPNTGATVPLAGGGFPVLETVLF